MMDLIYTQIQTYLPWVLFFWRALIKSVISLHISLSTQAPRKNHGSTQQKGIHPQARNRKLSSDTKLASTSLWTSRRKYISVVKATQSVAIFLCQPVQTNIDRWGPEEKVSKSDHYQRNMKSEAENLIFMESSTTRFKY